MKVLEGIQRSADFLAKKGVESPRLQAELLLAHILKLARMQLYLQFERELNASETDLFREFVKRRGKREPLQYIVGTTSFCGYEIAVEPGVLIPRPETELLAELGWRFLLGLPADQRRLALDFGTGSGCIAIALAGKCPQARVTALDASPVALGLAARNASRNGVADRVQFLESQAFSALCQHEPVDLLISNPPYIPAAEIATLEPEVRDHEPRAALDGGADGLDFYRLMASQAGPLLRPGGKLMCEFGDGQADSLRAMFEQQNWIVEAIEPDYTQRQRILVAKSSRTAG